MHSVDRRHALALGIEGDLGDAWHVALDFLAPVARLGRRHHQRAFGGVAHACARPDGPSAGVTSSICASLQSRRRPQEQAHTPVLRCLDNLISIIQEMPFRREALAGDAQQ